MSVHLGLRTTIGKLALFYALVFGTMTVVAIAVAYVQSTRLAMREIRAALAEQSAGLIDVYRDEGADGLVREIVRRGRANFDPEAIYALWSPEGALLAGNVSPPLPLPLPQSDGGEIQLTLAAGPDPGAQAHTAIASLMTLPDRSLLLVGRDVASRLTARAETLWLIGWTLVMVALLGVGGALVGGQHLLRRVAALATTTRRIAAGELQQRVATHGSGDEFDRLAEAVNLMLDRIEDLNGGMQTVIDSIAHDLRKPLTHARQALETAFEDADAAAIANLERVDTALARIQSTLDALLHIVQADAGANTAQMEPCLVDTIVTDLVELYEPLAQAAGVRLDAQVSGPLRLTAHRQLLAQALANLLDNAVKYAADTGVVEVRAGASDRSVRISVSDHGPGIPAAQRDRATQRFVRLVGDDRIPGSGLGLSVAAAVASLHRGRLLLEDAGPGLRATLELPLVRG